MRRRPTVALAAIGIGIAVSACGSSSATTSSAKNAPVSSTTSTTTVGPAGGVNPNAPEVVAPGDIPDTQAFVPYAATGYSFSVPEGWSRTVSGSTTTFSDHYNSIAAVSAAAPVAPTTATVQAAEVPSLTRDVPNFELIKVSTVTRTAGPAILVTYRAGSAPNPVTGKRVAIDVERYEFWHNGRLVTLTLSGARGSDNVDPWKKVTDSFAWTA